MTKRHIETVKCPRCGREAHRVRRKPFDRVLSMFMRVRRYRCNSCHWSGLLMRRTSHQQ